MQNLNYRFETFRMSEDGNIEGYLHQVNDIVNTIRGIGEKIEESEFVRKMTRTLPNCYEPKKYAIEESHDMDKYTLDQIFATLFTVEIAQLNDQCNEKKEITFKITKKIDELETSNHMDEVEANFVRRWKKGSKKHKRKFPIKCFNCGSIGHFSSICTFREDNYKRSNDDNKKKDNYRRDEINKRVDGKDKSKRSFYSMETYSSKDEASVDSNEELLFLDIEEKDSERSSTPHDQDNNERSIIVKTRLHAKVEPKAWIIYYGCSNNMIDDKNKFID